MCLYSWVYVVPRSKGTSIMMAFRRCCCEVYAGCIPTLYINGSSLMKRVVHSTERCCSCLVASNPVTRLFYGGFLKWQEGSKRGALARVQSINVKMAVGCVKLLSKIIDASS